MAKLLPVLLAIMGLGLGVGAGFMLKPDTASAPHAEEEHAPPAETLAAQEAVDETVEFVKLNNQFVVPVVEDDKVTALVVLSLSLEVTLGERANVYQLEPKFRDAFLRVMFDHANSGGFRGTFTASTNMTALRVALVEAARSILGNDVRDVLIIDLVRQDT